MSERGTRPSHFDTPTPTLEKIFRKRLERMHGTLHNKFLQALKYQKARAFQEDKIYYFIRKNLQLNML